jgi:hypothetical protein
MVHRLPSEVKPILTKILWNNTAKTWHVTTSDTEVLGLIARLARIMGVRADSAGAFTFPHSAELGPDNFSPEARARIEWGYTLDPHQNEPRPLVQNVGGKVVECASIAGPEKPRMGLSQVGPVMVVKPPTVDSIPDPRDTPAPTPSSIALKPLFGG